MGCCISTNSEAPASPSKKHLGSDEAFSKLKGFSHERQSRAPPPSVEEETVKEVLSETPKPKPMKQNLLEEDTKISARKVEEAFAKIQEKQNLSNNEEIMSQVSEICSVSESVSTMTNVTDKRDSDEEEEQEVRQRQRVISGSPSKPQSRNGLKMDQSPTRISQQSPARRIGNGSVSLVQNQEARRDPGESSGRRSGFPATTRSSALMGRSQSARSTNRSPSRVRSGPIENSDGTNFNSSRKMEGKWASSNYNNNNKNKDNFSTNDSLENPLVSLECFIFL